VLGARVICVTGVSTRRPKLGVFAVCTTVTCAGVTCTLFDVLPVEVFVLGELGGCEVFVLVADPPSKPTTPINGITSVRDDRHGAFLPAGLSYLG